MNILAFLLGIVAFVLFVVEAVRTKSLVAAGLAVYVSAWIVASVWVTSHGVSLT